MLTTRPTAPEPLSCLPAHLAERCRVLAARTPPSEGEFVLYWMHHAVRGHENPALDAALALAEYLDRPVLVYQGLGGRHRFNNDRHHTFILQGARDAHRELRERGVRAVFSLGQSAARRSPLAALAARAVALVVEDFPLQPFVDWTRRLAQRTPAPVIAVDCCCVLPMQRLETAYPRAFEFRRATATEYRERVPRPWPALAHDPVWFDGRLGFAPVDLEHADVAALCAASPIDHGVPPVADTPGGSAAGYARWRTFREHGLQRYAHERNDAALRWPRGVSRLSPYLHHGHVAPFRIAREAWQAGGEGAEKFLDELLVWRELSHNFCFFTADPERLDALPDWARETLHRHAGDWREQLIDRESLARSRTDDPLWNLAQTSLRVHGELHNNLRMTWAKALPYWCRDAQATLETLIDLNHRYALDGCDPNSYGGLLWALGLFDRPFPASPVIGRLRARSTQVHARRLDLKRYRERVSRPAGGTPLRVAVVGAGIAGLSAARTLHDQGHRVTVFDKSRGVGGRAATRRRGDIGFDHGAQYFTVRDARFGDAVAAWRERGVVARWPGRIGRVDAPHIEPLDDGVERLVGVPGMSAIGRHLAADLAVRTGVRVAPPRYERGCWRLHGETGDALGEFDSLVIALPAPQAAALLQTAAADLATQAAAVRYAPTWALMIEQVEASAPSYDGLFFNDGPIAWAARNGSKPGRLGHTWVVHASADWTRSRLDAPADEVAERLLAALCGATGLDLSVPVSCVAHRWLYARVDEPLAVGALWDPELRLALCGDWCHGARIEGAYLSGQAAAGYLLRELSRRGAREPTALAAAIGQ